ncbi:MAG: lysophospholipase [Weeksellaceae bacterium]|nr:lysophospholipase [Weeksellaceae bacterium]
MKKFFGRIFDLIFSFFPSRKKLKNMGVTPAEAATLRQRYTGPHQLMTTTDGKTLFIRKWNPAGTVSVKKDIAVLIFHGLTAHSGAYNALGETISRGGYDTFGLDYRGHGLSDGNRADTPSKERWIADLAESIKYVKDLGYSKVILLGHSLGVIASMCATNAVQNKISGLVLLSAAYESRKGSSKPPTTFQKAKILLNSILRPSYPAIGYNRDGLVISEDPLYNYRYTLRFVRMLDLKKLRLPNDLNIPVLVGVGDKDELFSIEKVRDFYDLVPSKNKTFFVMKNASHAVIPTECFQEIVSWLDKNY